MSTISSIDAFEASFQTDFPDSFSPREDSEKKSSTDAYNPFYPSPQRAGFDNSVDDDYGDDDDEPEPPVRSQQSSPRSSSIRERALLTSSAYRRTSGTRQSGASDPPGRDRTSTRKTKSPMTSASQPGRSPTSGNKTPSPGSARKVVTDGTISSASSPSTLAPGNKSPLSNGTPKMKLPLFTGSRSPRNDGSSGSPRFFRRTSPATPSQSSPVASEAYRTPSPISQPSPHGVSDPPRPEKSGHELARIRYEKAYGPSSKLRVNGVDRSFASTTSDASGDSLPGMSNRVRNGIRARVAEYEKASSPMKMKSKADTLYAPRADEDGDIPMRSNIPKHYVSPSKNKNNLVFDAPRKFATARGIDVTEDDELRLNPNKGRDLVYGGPGYTKAHSASNLMRSEEVVRNAGWR